MRGLPWDQEEEDMIAVLGQGEVGDGVRTGNFSKIHQEVMSFGGREEREKEEGRKEEHEKV